MNTLKSTSHWLFAMIFMLTIPLPLSEQVVIVTSEADQYAVAGEPIQGTVTITREKSKKIDPNSFKLDGKPLGVEFAKDVTFGESSNLVLSIYHFTIPPQKKGLQTLPPVSVKVDGREYSSNESTYQVGR